MATLINIQKITTLLLITIEAGIVACTTETNINRFELVNRNNPTVTNFDPLTPLSVGNGEFAVTVDPTGLQSFPTYYTDGIPLGTMAQWGWHSFINTENFKHDETLKVYDFGKGKQELYAVQSLPTTRQQNAAQWFRANPHRLHLGIVGFEFQENVTPDQFTNLKQTLDLWKGIIYSNYTINEVNYHVETTCHPTRDMLAVHITNANKTSIKLQFPYPTGQHTDDACDWNNNDKHHTTIVAQGTNNAVLKRIIDQTTYFVTIQWTGNATLQERKKNYFTLQPQQDDWHFTCQFTTTIPELDGTEITEINTQVNGIQQLAATHWKQFWNNGAAVDFSLCTDPRAKELERRVVLSQYLLAIQCAGSIPPQETGLTYNSWFGKFHLEMVWWHQVHWALWKRTHLLTPTMQWFEMAESNARVIAQRQQYQGVRWMKMTDPLANEAPSDIGSFLVWQQPHYIYIAELLYRQQPTKTTLDKYKQLVQETTQFIYSFATKDSINNQYNLKGLIPAQETLMPQQTLNPPLELAYWYFALTTAQKWNERCGEKRNQQWDQVIDHLAKLAQDDTGRYLAAENAIDTYTNQQYTSDHPAALGAIGMLPQSTLLNQQDMKNTLLWILDNWNWHTAWGWDFPMTAMCAARLGEPNLAVDALLMKQQANTYLLNGHNYQNERLRLYLPGNGGLLTAVAMMCAGWDGCQEITPGFPKNGRWKVKWEGLEKMP